MPDNMDADSDDSDDDQQKEVVGCTFYVKRITTCLCALMLIVAFGWTAINLRGGEAPEEVTRFKCDPARREVNFTRIRMVLRHGQAVPSVADSGPPVLHFERLDGVPNETFAIAIAGVSGAGGAPPPADPQQLLDAVLAEHNSSAEPFRDFDSCSEGSMSSDLTGALSLKCKSLAEGDAVFGFAAPRDPAVVVHCTVTLDRKLLHGRSAETLHLLTLHNGWKTDCNTSIFGEPGNGGPYARCLSNALAVGTSTAARQLSWAAAAANNSDWGGAAVWSEAAVRRVMGGSSAQAASFQSYASMQADWLSVPVYPLGALNATTEFVVLIWR